MIYETINLTCPNCGASVFLDENQCRYCSSPVVIRTVNNFDTPHPSAGDNGTDVQTENHNMSAAYSFLRAKLYDKAIAAYDSVINANFNNSDAHFFAAAASLKGKRPFVVSAGTIKKAEEYLQTAIAIEPKGIYYYFLSYIRLDHHFRKFYKASPDYKELYMKAVQLGLSQTDVADLYATLGSKRPPEI